MMSSSLVIKEVTFFQNALHNNVRSLANCVRQSKETLEFDVNCSNCNHNCKCGKDSINNYNNI